jgi:hypothetical protein
MHGFNCRLSYSRCRTVNTYYLRYVLKYLGTYTINARSLQSNMFGAGGQRNNGKPSGSTSNYSDLNVTL